MNRFLLLALTAGLFSPIAAKADKTFLIMEFGVEMVDMKQCEQEGERWLASQQVTVRGQMEIRIGPV